jgi:predicted nucleic acid-binding protein
MAIRAVLDTNVVLAAGGSSNTNSPNREIVHRWLAGEITLLVTDDIIAEYAEKLASHGKSTQERIEFLSRVFLLSETVEIRFFHLRHDPADLPLHSNSHSGFIPFFPLPPPSLRALRVSPILTHADLRFTLE